MAVQLDHNFFTNENILPLSPGAKLLLLASMCYADRHLTDGFVPAVALPLIAAEAGVKASEHRELLAGGNWYAVERGWQIHDYLEYQNSAAEITAKRRNNAARQQRHREAKASNREGSADLFTGGGDPTNTPAMSRHSNALRNAPVTPSVTHPNPTQPNINPTPPPPAPSRDTDAVPVSAGLGGGGGSLADVAESLSPEDLLQRFRAERPECESRLAESLAAAKGAVRSQPKYLQPLILRILGGKEPDPITAAARGGQQSVAPSKYEDDPEWRRARERRLGQVPPDTWPALEAAAIAALKQRQPGIRPAADSVAAEMARQYGAGYSARNNGGEERE